MDRRRFLLTSLAGGLAAPLAAEAQQPGKKRIGLLGPGEEPRFSEIASGLKQGLREQGYRRDPVVILSALGDNWHREGLL